MSAKDYKGYTLEDFVLDEDFFRWVRNPTKRDVIQWNRFLKDHPEKQDIISQARRVVLATNIPPEQMPPWEIRNEVTRFLDKVHYGSERKIYPLAGLGKTRIRPVWLLRLAGVAVGVAAILLFVFDQQKPSKLLSGIHSDKTVSERLKEVYNDSDLPMEMKLHDHSTVVLSPGSKLRYPEEFQTGKRLVYLSGEADFSVTHQKAPFIVVSGNMITKVLGTKFRVRAFDSDRQNSVEVQSGKVSVYSQQGLKERGRELKGLILTANQVAIFEKSDSNLSKSIAPNPVPVELIPDEVEYNGTPLSSILGDFQKIYGIPIQYDEQSLSACKITATFSNETFFEQMEMLCKIASASYEIVDGQIIVSSAGCE